MKRVFSITLLIMAPQIAFAQYTVDHDYAPPYWLTPTNFVDDWQKSLVDPNGQFAYDFGPGPYVRPKTTVSIFVNSDDSRATNQGLLNANVPIVLTTHDSEKYTLDLVSFSLVPDNDAPLTGTSPDSQFVQTNGLVGSVAWAPALPDVDPAFRSVTWGTGRSINYRIRVTAGSSKRIALGFNDVYRSGKISRAMDLSVDGAPTRTVDLLKTGKQGEPQVFFFDARDVDEDGWINIDIGGAREALDPNTFVNGIWVFESGSKISSEEVISGAASASAELRINCGSLENEPPRVRRDVIRAHREGTGSLQVEIKSIRPLRVDSLTGSVFFGDLPFVQTSPAFQSSTEGEQGITLHFPEEIAAVDVLITNSTPAAGPSSFPNLDQEQSRTVAYWQTAPIPTGRLTVPDKKVQEMLDASIRTLYQIRDVVDGHAQFQPGPSVYRGLWYVDGAWAVEAALFAGDEEAARETIAALISHQDSTGRAGVIRPALLHRETAHLIYIICRYARFTQDWEWLEENWQYVVKGMEHMIELRQRASKDPSAPYFGLMPPGLTDGGIGGIGSTYGSTYWGLIGVAEVVKTAKQRSKPEASKWEAEYLDFLAAFERARQRDERLDAKGNTFLPIKMDYNPTTDLPQRGQWGPIHSLYAGEFLDPESALVQGTMQMLEDNVQEDHVVSLGWLTGGIWPIFEAHRAIAYNYLGQPDDAERLLYSFANHSSPTYVWVEEQMLKGRGTRATGDVPHTMGNVQAVRLLRYLLMMEKRGNLELLSGLPLSWLQPGARLEALSMPTFFGPVSLRMSVNSEGTHGSLWVETPDTPLDADVTLFLGRLKESGFEFSGEGIELPDVVPLDWGSITTIDFKKE